MTETPRDADASEPDEPPTTAPYSSKVTTSAPPPTDDDSDTIYTEQPDAGVTDVYGQPLAGSAQGGGGQS